MKTIRAIWHLIVLAAAVLYAVSCTTVTTTTKDGTVTVTKQPAPGVLPFAGAVLEAYSPRAIVVREEKSGPIDVHKMGSKSFDVHETAIREHQTITTEEIANRWKP
jgi:hypothetical protein